MPSTSNDMISIGFHTSFRLVTKYGCICKRDVSHTPIRILDHSNMVLTPSLRLWVRMILNEVSTFPWLHLVFDVELLRPYFSSLLGTSKVDKNLDLK
jgi:hypothetical protein